MVPGFVRDSRSFRKSLQIGTCKSRFFPVYSACYNTLKEVIS